MVSLRCKACGGECTRDGHLIICNFCGSIFEDERFSGDIQSMLDLAWNSILNLKFDSAEEMFSNVIERDAKNYEAYWGRALAKYNIRIIATDENTRSVPTFHKISDKPFTECKDYSTAIQFATDKIRDAYIKLANEIERVRNLIYSHRNDPPYDVFISYKDKENGKVTDDRNTVYNNIYRELTEKGYKVFFSNVTLEHHIGEEFEPYIYNAIRTAKVMIVYGSKAEYFNSPWIRNEWSRFNALIEAGFKDKQSLITVYKNCDPNEFPTILSKKQGIEFDSYAALGKLFSAVETIVSKSVGYSKLDRITVDEKKYVKKDISNQEAIKLKEFEPGESTSFDVSEKIKLAEVFLRNKNFEEAEKKCKEILFENPQNSQALVDCFLAKNCCVSFDDFLSKDDYSSETFKELNKLIEKLNSEKANGLIRRISSKFERENDNILNEFANIILQFAFDGRDAYIKNGINVAINKTYPKAFDTFLKFINTNSTDVFIDYNYKFAAGALESNQCRTAIKYCDRVLEYDGGHNDTLWLKIRSLVKLEEENADETIGVIEQLLSCCGREKINVWIADVLSLLADAVTTNNNMLAKCVKLSRRVVKYSVGVIKGSQLETPVTRLIEIFLRENHYEDAKYFCDIFGGKDVPAIVYLYKAMALAEIPTEKDIVNSKNQITKIPEFNKYLALADNSDSDRLLGIAQEQEKEIQKYHEALAHQEKIKANKFRWNCNEIILSIILGIVAGIGYVKLLEWLVPLTMEAAEDSTTELLLGFGAVYGLPLLSFVFIMIYDFIFGTEGIIPHLVLNLAYESIFVVGFFSSPFEDASIAQNILIGILILMPAFLGPVIGFTAILNAITDWRSNYCDTIIYVITPIITLGLAALISCVFVQPSLVELIFTEGYL